LENETTREAIEKRPALRVNARSLISKAHFEGAARHGAHNHQTSPAAAAVATENEGTQADFLSNSRTMIYVSHVYASPRFWENRFSHNLKKSIARGNVQTETLHS
jgi:hypothetical protein